MHVAGLLKRLLGRQVDLAPSLYDVVPDASTVPRTLPQAEVVPAICRPSIW